MADLKIITGGVRMSEAQEAWALWQQLQTLSDDIWSRYENAFVDFCIAEAEDNQYCGIWRNEITDKQQPL
jgi:hypothetical protein